MSEASVDFCTTSDFFRLKNDLLFSEVGVSTKGVSPSLTPLASSDVCGPDEQN